MSKRARAAEPSAQRQTVLYDWTGQHANAIQLRAYRVCEISCRHDDNGGREVPVMGAIASQHPIVKYIERDQQRNGWKSGLFGDWYWYDGEDDHFKSLDEWVRYKYVRDDGPITPLQAFAIMAMRAVIQEVVFEMDRLPTGVPMMLEALPRLRLDCQPSSSTLDSYMVMRYARSDAEIIDFLRDIKAMEVPRVQFLYNLSQTFKDRFDLPDDMTSLVSPDAVPGNSS